MGIHYQKTNIHWNYFLSIESDFEKISRYVEFTKSNDKTFSIELARIIMASTQEVDGVLKKFCKLLEEGCNPKNIKDYRDIIKEKSPKFITETVHISRFGMRSKPWINWKKEIDNNSPEWWIANNNIKHNRTENFQNANLKNAYNSLGALLIATLYLYKLELETITGETIDWQNLTNILKPKTILFTLKDEYYHEPGHWVGIEW